MINKTLSIVLNILLLTNIFYLVWEDKFSAVVLFLITLVIIWRVTVVDSFKPWLTSATILQYVIFPLVYLLSYTESTQSKIIVALLYLPVIFRLVPRIMDTVYFEQSTEGGKEIKIKEDTSYYANLLYLYATPILLYQDVKFAYGILAMYSLLYVFGLEGYILRPIPLWERVLHIVGLSAILLLLSLSF
jgi:hypothetical protein